MKEVNETEYQNSEAPVLCANNCGFFGSAMTNNLCSKCYRDHVMKQQTLVTMKPPAATSSSTITEPAQEHVEKHKVKIVENVEEKLSNQDNKKQQPSRCLLCRKKVGLTGFMCRCGSTFCSSHRFPETHECSFDYKAAGREAIAKENPVVKADKIEKI
ncbi:Zinc finger A20 and AN1 domain-containing stress-associated protein 9 [Apostasia shenzhenica]|uniref:Zinc finger A20 and AN1 domain-containing stress-associated protein 9 n=1 Tax=Apostasia shenzhenica TaxID=1088818 RepID=A0A2I0AW66_9ASPA|nr:Zinc finger A20 and AN1 domain-containing stress-associated protein 9 [Apostasia shenzhenica]